MTKHQEKTKVTRNGYHEPKNCTAILRLEASMMQAISQEQCLTEPVSCDKSTIRS
jgi:hypothetical protein